MKINPFFRLLVCFLLGLVIFKEMPAQQESFKHFNVEDGLPQNYIYSISQTSKGALLVATGEGLVRYNGQGFDLIGHEDSLLQKSFVTASHLFDSTTNFQGHYNGEISKYENGKLHLIVPAGEFGSIKRIFSDAWGRLWFLNQQQQIRYLTKDNHELIDFSFETDASNANDAIVLSETQLLLATNGGAYLAEIANTQKLELQEIPSLKYKNVVGITRLNEDFYWLSTEDDGIYSFKFSGEGNSIPELEKVNLPDSVTRGIRSVVSDSWGNVWIGRKNSGLSKLVFLRNKMEVINYAYAGENDMKLVNCLFQDVEGTMWIGTYGKGLFQKTDKVLQHYRLDAFGGANDVRSLLELNQQHILLGTTEGLVKAKYSKTGLYGIEFYTGLYGKTITGLAKDEEQNIWIGTESNGVYVLQGSRIRRSSNLSELDNKSINHLRVDKQGKVWIATNTEGVVVLHNDQKIVYNTASGLPHNQVIMTSSDNLGRNWYATFGGALATSKNGEFVLHDSKSGLDAYNFNSICSDSKGNVWIATYGEGLYSFNIVQFNKFNQNDDLLSLYNYLVVCDDFDNLWLGSRAGISRIDPSSGQVFNYKIPEAEVNTNAVIKSENGDLWFGTNNGIYRHGFKSYIHNTVPPVTSLVCYVMGRDSVFEWSEKASWDYTDSPISFVLEGMSLKSPENVRYRYKMDGYRSEWSTPQISNVISIGNLREKNYTLYFQSTNNDGVWGQVRQFAFEVKPPFWRSWWFYITTVISVLIVLIVVVKWREKSLRESNMKLEETVKQRTATVIAQKEEIEEKNRDIQDSIDYASRIQQAILSDKELQYDHVQEMFVLYIPKDVVSGDFYWINESSDSLIVAAADCTGHGVPGAFMSFIGASGLRRTVIDKEKERPDEVLNSLNQFVSTTLQQKQPDDIIKDGMDITICRIHKNGFQFAGAQNPIYKVSNGELDEINGDKQPIGHMDVESKPFTVHDFERKSGDMVYMFSDGYADQFGGPRDKKFMYKQFKELLVEISNLNAGEQEEKLKHAFLQWRGTTEQVDDVLVIGLRL